MPHIVLLGTLDTKLSEILYLRSCLYESSTHHSKPLRITLIDCGSTEVSHEAITISIPNLIKKQAPHPRELLSFSSRGPALRMLVDHTKKCVADLVQQGDVHGVLSAGGSGGTSVVSDVMRATIPIGVPKLLVSTVASGDTGHIVGDTDITMMYSVVDIAGMNGLLRTILSNAAGAMAGMASMYESSLKDVRGLDGHPMQVRWRVGITMFGVTTPCVTKIREILESQYPVEVYVFHATGHGGKAMERLVANDQLDAVLDITTTEICDQVVGGCWSAGPNRLEAALRKGIPNIISLGATDMVNFGPRTTIPAAFTDRKLLEHNSNVTLMRTTKAECVEVGSFIVEKIKKFTKTPEMVQVWLPKGGFSILSVHGGLFADEDSDVALMATVKEGLKGTGITVIEDDRAINDEDFAESIARELVKLIGIKPR